MASFMRPAGDAKQVERQLDAMLQEAREAFAARQVRKTLDRLHAGQALAAAHGLHRRAAELKRGLAILGNGGRPKLLTSGQSQQRGGRKEKHYAAQDRDNHGDGAQQCDG